jgi:hypothetical protein
MNLANFGKTLAGQAIEGAKNTMAEAIRTPEPAKTAPETMGSAILGQIQAMQRPLPEDQELVVTVRAGDETLRVAEIFVPNALVLVFAGFDVQGNVMRVIVPAEAAHVVCKIVKVAAGLRATRVNILTPKPRP